MEHLFGATFHGAAHLQHLAAGVDADQQAVLPQSMAERLLPHRETLRPGHLLSHLIAGGRLQEKIIPNDPTDAGAPRDPCSASWLATPAADFRRFWHPPSPVRHMGMATR